MMSFLAGASLGAVIGWCLCARLAALLEAREQIEREAVSCN